MDAETFKHVHEAAVETLSVIDPDSVFEEFPKIARLSRECTITEKIDGTNAQISVSSDGTVRAGSRNRWVTPESDNFGFARWVAENEAEIRRLLGFGRHFGEWWGAGIGRRYDQKVKRFSLFNTARWFSSIPAFRESGLPIDTVPILYTGVFSTEAAERQIAVLRYTGSFAAPGFMQPEGIVVYHKAANVLFKKTLEKDELPKAMAGEAA